MKEPPRQCLCDMCHFAAKMCDKCLHPDMGSNRGSPLPAGNITWKKAKIKDCIEILEYMFRHIKKDVEDGEPV